MNKVVREPVERARDDDLLTREEQIKHKQLVLAGIREELISWINLDLDRDKHPSKQRWRGGNLS